MTDERLTPLTDVTDERHYTSKAEDGWVATDIKTDTAVTVYNTLRAANEARDKLWDPRGACDAMFHALELAGEVGELCNVIKKLKREAAGLPGSRASSAELADELADVQICVDKLAMMYNIDLNPIVADKFNRTSEKIGLPVFLSFDYSMPELKAVASAFAGRIADKRLAEAGLRAMAAVDLDVAAERSRQMQKVASKWQHETDFEDIVSRLEKLERWAHEPFDFSDLIARLEKLELWFRDGEPAPERDDAALAPAPEQASPSPLSDEWIIALADRHCDYDAAVSEVETYGTFFAFPRRDLIEFARSVLNAAVVDHAVPPAFTTSGVEAINKERERQIVEEGFGRTHDAANSIRELADAAIAYLRGDFRHWPKKWNPHWFKPTTQRRDLEKAGALIAAALDRMDQ